MRFITNDFDTPKAEKVFVDRIEPRQLFWQHYDRALSAPMQSPVVLCYYGIGGIGKSALNRQLSKEMGERDPKAKFLQLDFQFVERREPYRILALLRKKLSDKYGYSFPLFELAYYSLLSQMGEEISKPEAQSFISDSPVLTAALEIAGYVPGASMVADVIKKIDDGVSLFRKLFPQSKPMLTKLMATDPTQLLEELPIYFAADLRNNLEKETKPFVIFIDTYEKLVNELAAIGDPLRNDTWLRGKNGLIQRLPGVIWVISGREKLKWDLLDAPGHWDGVLHQYLLGTLSQSDTVQFLQNAGIHDSGVQNSIYSHTEGLPVYLDLCVEQYLQGGSEALEVTPGELFERCTRYMSDSEKNILFLLACLGTWTDESAYAAGQKMPFDFSPVFYEKLLSFSFVQTSDGVHYTLMRQVGNVLVENCPAAIRHACTQVLIGAPAAAPLQQDQPQPEAAADLDLMADAAQLIRLMLSDVNSEEDLNSLLDELDDLLFTLAETYQLSTLYDYLTPLWELAESTYPQSRSFARVQTFHSMGLYKSGDYDEAESHGLAALQLLRQLKGDIGGLEVAVHNISIQYGDRLQFSKIPPLFEGLWEELTAALGTQNQLAQSIAHYIAVSYDTMEQKAKADLWYSRYDTEAMTEYGNSYVPTEQEAEIAELEKQALAFAEAGDFDNAMEMQGDAVVRCKELFGTTAIAYLRAAETLASYFSKAGAFHNAATLQRETAQLYADALGLHDGGTALARMSLYQYLMADGQVEEAEAMTKEVAADLMSAFGRHFSAALTFRFSALCDYFDNHTDEILSDPELARAVITTIEDLTQDMQGAENFDSEIADIMMDTFDRIASAIVEAYETEQTQSVPAALCNLQAAIEAKTSSCSHIWLKGEPENKKLQNALKKFGSGLSAGDVLMLVDTAVTGSGKSGALFTETEMIYKVIGNEGRVSLSDIVGLEIGKTEVKVCIDRKEPVSLITARERDTLAVLAAFLNMQLM